MITIPKRTDKIRKCDLIAEVAAILERTENCPESSARACYHALIQAVQNCVEDGFSVSMPGLARLDLRVRSRRKFRSPSTGEMISLSPRLVPFFTPGPTLKRIAADVMPADPPTMPADPPRSGRGIFLEIPETSPGSFEILGPSELDDFF